MRHNLVAVVGCVLLSLSWACWAEYRPLSGARYAPLSARVASAKPLCVKIDGVDWDLDKIRAEYHTAWTWPDMTEQSLRKHLASEHHVPELDQLSFADLQMIHAVIHQRRVKPVSAPVPVAPRQAPMQRQSCPGGVCPSRRNGWFFQWH